MRQCNWRGYAKGLEHRDQDWRGIGVSGELGQLHVQINRINNIAIHGVVFIGLRGVIKTCHAAVPEVWLRQKSEKSAPGYVGRAANTRDQGKYLPWPRRGILVAPAAPDGAYGWLRVCRSRHYRDHYRDH